MDAHLVPIMRGAGSRGCSPLCRVHDEPATEMTYTVTLPGSEHYVLTANDRSHWSVHSDTRRYWRGLARLLFKGKPHYQRARVTVTFRFPDRRRRDVANLHPYVIKPILDGMVDAGVLPDDDDEHLVGPDPRRCPERGPFQVSVTVEEL